MWSLNGCLTYATNVSHLDILVANVLQKRLEDQRVGTAAAVVKEKSSEEDQILWEWKVSGI